MSGIMERAPSTVLGLDIGGANLKAVHSDGSALSRPFALWRDPVGLADALQSLMDLLPSATRLAVTMTGELCDCFESKRQGVAAILDAVEAVSAAIEVRVWCNEGKFLDLASARTLPLKTAAANWLALATFAGRFAPQGSSLLIDIGSTTTDLVPLLDGVPIPAGLTDPERLRCGELVYTGVRRTPLCALLQDQVAAEVFATALDLYLHLGFIAEDPRDCNTADGRPATRTAADARLARMLCADLETSSPLERQNLVLQAAARQQMLLTQGLQSVLSHLPEPPRTVVLAGEGEFLGAKLCAQMPMLAQAHAVSLNALLGPSISRAACAHALVVLAMEDI
jgi:probable H4MPT-linked C1 transfer pathway protein